MRCVQRNGFQNLHRFCLQVYPAGGQNYGEGEPASLLVGKVSLHQMTGREVVVIYWTSRCAVLLGRVILQNWKIVHQHQDVPSSQWALRNKKYREIIFSSSDIRGTGNMHKSVSTYCDRTCILSSAEQQFRLM